MSERDTKFLLQDILEAISNIRNFTKDLNFEKYQADLKTRHAVERNFSIIGEAVARMDLSFRNSHAFIDWRQVKDFRNIIVHDYFGIDDSIVWDIIQLNLNQLEGDIRKVLSNIQD